jgi:hypothetical protein
MAVPKERRRPRKKPAKKATKKVANSKVAEAQQAAKAKQDSLKAQGEADRKARLAQYAANQQNPTKLEPRTSTPMANSGRGVPQDKIAERDVGTAASKAAQQIAGLMNPLIKTAQANAREKDRKQALANIDLYGASNKDRAAKIAQLQNAYQDQQNQQIKTQGRAVWMGQKTAKIRNRGPQRIDPDSGADYTLEKGADEVVTKEELMSWLTDDAKVKQIMAAAQKAGLDVQTYEDAAKLWGSVVDMAAASYSFAGKKVSPWSIIQLRGKYVGPNGRPKDKTVTQRTVNEVSPADARLLFEKTATEQLGRAPTKAEVDDFIAKAQTIAKEHPDIKYTTQHMGFDGEVESENVRNSPGGADALAQQAALDKAKQSEDYGAYQAAGTYFPALFEALQSPV